MKRLFVIEIEMEPHDHWMLLPWRCAWNDFVVWALRLAH